MYVNAWSDMETYRYSLLRSKTRVNFFTTGGTSVASSSNGRRKDDKQLFTSLQNFLTVLVPTGCSQHKFFLTRRNIHFG